MPIFEYECQNCGRVVEKIYPSADAAPQAIEVQDSEGCVIFTRKISAPSFTVHGFNARNGYAAEKSV